MEITFTMPTDNKGLVGRECPVCKRYFKVKFDTGLKNPSSCHCPYCNHVAPHDKFWTEDQLNYARSIALNYATNKILGTIKKYEVKAKPNQFISFEIKVNGKPTPIAYYREKDLELDVCCKSCTLEYAIYGKFAYCPECGIHNSHEIFIANIDFFKKMLELSQAALPEISNKIVENALEDSISVFDGFCRNALKLKDNSHNISFQNIENARNKLIQRYGFDVAQGIDRTGWGKVIMAFQKRHLLAHNLGIIDQDYIDKTNSNSSLVGKALSISREEVIEINDFLKKIAESLSVFVS